MNKIARDNEIKLKQVKLYDEPYYLITNNDAMRPFFMSIVSDSNHWMFIASNGGVSAGRKDADNSLFPYYTDDKITESSDTTGSKSIFRVTRNGSTNLWEPFSERQMGLYNVSRNLYKNVIGNKVMFEEVNHDLGLTFRYQWSSSNQFGFVRKSFLINNSESQVSVQALDGIQNILPYGVNADLQGIRSNLVDAYKKSELESEIGLGIYALSAIIVDRAEPSEALKANIVWSLGIENPTYLLSSMQLNAFRKGEKIQQETDIKAEKGAYLVSHEIRLHPGEEKNWIIVANVNQSSSAVASISDRIRTDKNLSKHIDHDVEIGSQRLLNLVYASDGLQLTADKRRNARHYANTLFNIMRGGIFDYNYRIEKWDFKNYLEKANKEVYQSNESVLYEMPDTFSLQELHILASGSQDQDFRRLAMEYMPLKFSRRHGDPSRPWNRFSINTRNEDDGSKILDYEGNWRDIFQNWEALAHAYPEFIESMIFKFLNASTFDGYNPYRVTKDGFDWEVIEEHDPWSYIGYWGDHQIIYLLKFLEIIQNYYPDKLTAYFTKDLFVYANVPYRIKSYEDLLKDPKDTITFDAELDREIRKKRENLGADGALLNNENQQLHKVNFVEKILATVLAKLSNFIPEAGIWLNTQRPEWNDANNALVGNGVSMVTLYYLRRFFGFFETLVASYDDGDIPISEELMTFFNGIKDTLGQHQAVLSENISDKKRKEILDGLGIAASKYREQIYNGAFSGKKAAISSSQLKDFTALVLKYLDQSIDANKRDDNMYHAYNLMTVKGSDEVSITYLDEMLEGQVGALSSGYLSAKSCLALLDAMKGSRLFREDQYSYLLYPDKELPRFVDKNVIAKEKVENSALLKQLLQDGNTKLVERDVNGNYHFNGNFNNAGSVKEAMEHLASNGYKDLVKKDYDQMLQLFEEVFNHKAFTGRSGTFFGYEGLGSIYWHMVSKLVLAVEECCLRAIEENESDEVVGRLLEHYYEINEGIGVHKSPELYGAFPTDPYSHTPSGKGAQQPGMTGQVKEDILSRMGELGVFVKDGQLQFNPCLLRADEFLNEPRAMRYIDVDQERRELQLYQHELAFTFCQVPVVYAMAGKNSLDVSFTDGSSTSYDDLNLEAAISSKVFQRTGEVESIKVHVERNTLK